LKKVVVVYSALYLRNYFRAGAVTARYTFVLEQLEHVHARVICRDLIQETERKNNETVTIR